MFNDRQTAQENLDTRVGELDDKLRDKIYKNELDFMKEVTTLR